MIMIGDRSLQRDSARAWTKTRCRRSAARSRASRSLTSEEAEGVLEEFYQMSIAHDYVVKGGIDYARKMLISAFGPEQARKMLDRLMKTLGNETLSFDALQQDRSAAARQVHPQRASANHRADSVAPESLAGRRAAVLAARRSCAPDVALRMASLDQISPEIISKIATVIGAKLKSLGELSRESYGGVRAVAEMFNRLDSEHQQGDPGDHRAGQSRRWCETIRHLMFVFEDLLLLDVNAVKELLAKVDRKILTVALKGTSDQMKNHMLQAMSQRGAEMLREDMEALGPIKIKEVEAAQQQIIAVVRQLEAEGVISLKGTAGEQYVV